MIETFMAEYFKTASKLATPWLGKATAPEMTAPGPVVKRKMAAPS